MDPSQSNSARRRNRRLIWIGAASLAGLLLAGYGVRQLATSKLPDATHRLTVPEAMVDGTYQLSEDSSHTEKADALARSMSAASHTTGVVNARYESVSSQAPSVLVLSGVYGQFENPGNLRRGMLSGARDGADGSTVAEPQDITPAGSDTTVTCQAFKILNGQAGWTVVPMCAWADGNTVAMVVESAPENVDLNRLAALTLKVRAEVRQPIG
ncbi:hypothetical protein [Streptomyces sp. NPDC058157]|uniref:hypothetical protein n=1 Tax=Streptomyces sp. NPDC058157 TaxID=3346360 RepID=UPI0036E82CBA